MAPDGRTRNEFRAGPVSKRITGPDDGPGQGLGHGGERLHYWVFGGPRTYQDDERDARGQLLPDDAAWQEQHMARLGAVIGGRSTYEAAVTGATRIPGGCPPSSLPTIPTSSRPATTSRS